MFRKGDIVSVKKKRVCLNRNRRPTLKIEEWHYLIISPYNKETTTVCVIAKVNKKRQYYVELDNRTRTDGLILCPTLAILDINNGQFIEKCPEDIFKKVVETICELYAFSSGE